MKLVRAIALSFLVLLAGAFAAGCCAPPKNLADSAGVQPARVIVKFNDAVSEPDNAEFISKLAAGSDIGVRYERPMSGGAHVYALDGVRDDAHLNSFLKGIETRPDVIYAQPDRKMKPLAPGKDKQ